MEHESKPCVLNSKRCTAQVRDEENTKRHTPWQH
jgi:hypothetical protein